MVLDVPYANYTSVYTQAVGNVRARLNATNCTSTSPGVYRASPGQPASLLRARRWPSGFRGRCVVPATEPASHPFPTEPCMPSLPCFLHLSWAPRGRQRAEGISRAPGEMKETPTSLRCICHADRLVSPRRWGSTVLGLWALSMLDCEQPLLTARPPACILLSNMAGNMHKPGARSPPNRRCCNSHLGLPLSCFQTNCALNLEPRRSTR